MKIVTIEQFKNETETTIEQNRDQLLDNTVLDIISNVRKNGDQALYDYTRRFDNVSLDSLVVKEEELEEAKKQVEQEFIQALLHAKENIADFHATQKEVSWFTEKQNGTMLGQKVTPLDKVGIYVPGGKAAYPSTVLMNVIPAKIAGVTSIHMTTPPDRNGKVNPYVLVAASIAGADQIYKVGGAQAIAALAYGTKSIPKVNKIVGPGNSYVARAKKWVYGDVAIDMIAGPSEICIIADESANPSYIAADLLSQAEHDEEATAICITPNVDIAKQVSIEVQKQLLQLDRKEIIEASLTKNGRIIVSSSLSEAFELANELAPEHLQIMVDNPSEKLPFIRHAGAIFLGNYSPEPLGDYFAGPNHTLPTNGTATFSSPLGVYDFMKKSSIIYYSKEALEAASSDIITLANQEGLTAHANSIKIRKENK